MSYTNKDIDMSGPAKRKIGRGRVDTVRGQQPTPTAILVARGSRLAKHRAPSPASVPDLDVKTWEGEYPVGLNDVCRSHWDSLKQSLDLLGVFSVTDKEAMIRHCHLIHRYRELTPDIMRWEDKVQSLPHMKEWYGVNTDLLRLEVQFGLTPQSRSGAQVTPKAEKPPHGNSTEGKKLKERFRREVR